MLERFDAAICRPDLPAWEAFRRDHLARYEIAARYATGSVLDAACGAGYGSRAFGRRTTYTGIDGCPSTIERAKEKYGDRDTRFRRIDFNSPAEMNTLGVYDAAVSLETAEHLPDPERFVRSLGPHIRDGGRLIFSVPTCPTIDFDWYHRRDWSAGRWQRLLESCGWSVKRRFHTSFTVKFSELRQAFEPSLAECVRVGGRSIRYGYAASRAWNWLARDRFDWVSTLWVCERS